MNDLQRRTAIRIYPGGRQEVGDTVACLILSVDAAIERLDRGFYAYIDPTDLVEFKQKWKPFNPFGTYESDEGDEDETERGNI